MIINDIISAMANNADLTRRRVLAFAGAGVVTGLAGCLGGGDGNNDTNDPTELPPAHVFTDYNNDKWQTKWEKTIKPEFEDETGIELELEYAGFSGDNESRLANLVQSGDPPALQTSTMDQIGDLWIADGLDELSEIVSAVESNVGELVTQPFHNVDGEETTYWELPHGYYTSTFIYRQDVYDELGLEVPTSFEQLLENARIIDEAPMDIRGYGLAGKKTGKSQDEYQVFLANMGVDELRWKDPDAKEEVELWFPKEEMVTLLEYQKELAQYSPDPSGIGWSESLSDWAGDKFAQQYNLNLWPGGVAADASEELAKNTKVAPLPRWEAGGISKEDSLLASPTVDGWHLFSNAENVPGGRRLLEWMYTEDTERTARLYETEPTRFLPVYSEVLESDAFTNYDHFQQYPSHLEQLKFVQNTIVEEYYDNNPEQDLVTSEVLQYYLRFFFIGEMVNQVVVADTPPERAYEQAKQQAEQRLQEARQKLGR